MYIHQAHGLLILAQYLKMRLSYAIATNALMQNEVFLLQKPEEKSQL
jgi:hypothetical protein